MGRLFRNRVHPSFVFLNTMEAKMSELVRGDGKGLLTGSLMAWLLCAFICVLTTR